MHYLAYGMNTNLSGMARRCPRAISLGKVTLMDHVLRFKFHADAEYQPGASMECALWTITGECERALDMVEGYPHYYEKKIVQVDMKGIKIDAMIYYMVSATQLQTPSQDYYNNVIQGYYQHDMDLLPLTNAYKDTLFLDIIDVKGTTC